MAILLNGQWGNCARKKLATITYTQPAVELWQHMLIPLSSLVCSF